MARRKRFFWPCTFARTGCCWTTRRPQGGEASGTSGYGCAGTVGCQTNRLLRAVRPELDTLRASGFRVSGGLYNCRRPGWTVPHKVFKMVEASGKGRQVNPRTKARYRDRSGVRGRQGELRTIPHPKAGGSRRPREAPLFHCSLTRCRLSGMVAVYADQAAHFALSVLRRAAIHQSETISPMKANSRRCAAGSVA